MEDKRINRAVKCNVPSCTYHCGEEGYCSLDCVCIGTHEEHPAVKPCTDCQSFVNKDAREQRAAAEQMREKNQSF